MEKEFHWKSKSGRAFFNAGFGSRDAVGAEKPSEAIPLQEGARLLFAKGVDRIWTVVLISAFFRLLTWPIRHRRRRHHKHQS